MLQSLDETIKKIGAEEPVPFGEGFIPRLTETLPQFGREVLLDLAKQNWHAQFNGGLYAGYLLAWVEDERAVQFLEESLRLFERERSEYSQPTSSVLEFIIETLTEFKVGEEHIDRFNRELVVAKDQETVTADELRLQLIHMEADLECATGDLDSHYSGTRLKQGKVLQELNRHEEAIEKFKDSMGEDRRNWQSETSITNRLLIVDSLLALDRTDDAATEFMGLMEEIGATSMEPDPEEGKPLSDLFKRNYFKFEPYLKHLLENDTMGTIASFVELRMGNIDPKSRRQRSEIVTNVKILASHYIDQEDYAKAAALYEEQREHLEYKHHLSRRVQAEYEIRAGNPERAASLIAEDLEEREGTGLDLGKKINEIVNIYLQLGQIKEAIDLLDAYCEYYKQNVGCTTHNELFETRVTQLEILKRTIGEDYLERFRDYVGHKTDLNVGNNELADASLPALPEPKKKRKKKK